MPTETKFPDWDLEIHVGLREPKLGGYMHLDFNQLRKEILAGQRDSALIRSCMTLADTLGLSAEDRYTYLAYHALVGFERQWQQLRQLWALQPMSPIRTKQTEWVGQRGDIGHSPPVYCPQHLCWCTDAETDLHKFYSNAPRPVGSGG